MHSLHRFTVSLLFFAMSSSSWPGEPGSVESARADLATRLEVPLEQVTAVARTERTWTDGSLGCPKPGMSYIQVLINGSQLILEAGGKRHYYHAKAGGEYFFCPEPTKAQKKGPRGSPDIRELTR